MQKELTVKLGGYKLTEFPGSESDIYISHDVWVDPEYQNFGIGQKLHKERIQRAREENKSLMMCVVNKDNKVQMHIMKKFNWTNIYEFTSECTCHQLVIFVRDAWRAEDFKQKD